MLVVMRCGATDRQIQGVVQAITELGCEARQLHSAQRTTVNVVGNDERIDSARLAYLDGVQDIARQVAIMMVIGLLVSAVSTEPAAAQDVTEVLATAQAKYRQIETLQAEFTQTLVNPMMGNETTTGTLYLAPPDRFSMRFAEPEGDRIVADGTWLWLHTPSTTPNQVIRQPIPDMGPATPNLFGQFVDRPLDRYSAMYAGRDSVAGYGVEKVRLIPRVEGIPFRSVVISLSADGMLRRVDIVEDSGQRRTLVFDSILVNAPIPPEELIFRVPKGTRIVTP